MTFDGVKLRAARKRAGMTSTQLGARVHRTAYTIARYENGAISPPVDVLVEISRALALPVETFLTTDYSRPNAQHG